MTDISTNHQLIQELINYLIIKEGVYRTVPATPTLFNTKTTISTVGTLHKALSSLNWPDEGKLFVIYDTHLIH